MTAEQNDLFERGEGFEVKSTRRKVLQAVPGTVLASHAAGSRTSAAGMTAAVAHNTVPVPATPTVTVRGPEPVPVTLRVNGGDLTLAIEPRVSLLDALREFGGLTGTKKGCNQGACGACTVLVDGERIISCLALAVQYQGREITTVEGLASDGVLHPLQQAFIEHDGFQCGYCTPGQICSAIGMAGEVARGVPSHVTEDLLAETMTLTGDELRERMSGNLCRCGAYNGIAAAISETFKEVTA